MHERAAVSMRETVKLKTKENEMQEVCVVD